MGHKIAEAIIEDGQIKYIDKKLPCKRIKVHLIYDEMEETASEIELKKIVADTSGIYKDINVEEETRILRESWERDACR